jgi:integrase/recombinase XerD
MAKNNRNGQAEVLNDSELDRIFKQLKSTSHKLFFAIARYTGERFGAIAKLQVSNVYTSTCVNLPVITFPANIRKGSPDGSRSTRQSFVVPRLGEALAAYRPADCDHLWLFPSSIKDDQCICWKAADSWLRRAVESAGLDNRGISGHSLRRSFITKLSESGMDIHNIQQITGHKSLSVVQLYIDKNPAKLNESLCHIFP